MISPRIFASSFIPGSIGRSEPDSRSSRYTNGIKGPRSPSLPPSLSRSLSLSLCLTTPSPLTFEASPRISWTACLREMIYHPVAAGRRPDRTLLPLLIIIENFPPRSTTCRDFGRRRPRGPPIDRLIRFPVKNARLMRFDGPRLTPRGADMKRVALSLGKLRRCHFFDAPFGLY